MAQPRAHLFRGNEEGSSGYSVAPMGHLQRAPARKQRCFMREGYRLQNPQQSPQAPSSRLICQTGCFPDRMRMFNSQTSVCFFFSILIRSEEWWGGEGMADGARVNKGVKCEKPPLQGNQDLCSCALVPGCGVNAGEHW